MKTDFITQDEIDSVLLGGSGVSHSFEDHDAKGISIIKGSLMNPDNSIFLKWENIARSIGELIAEGA